MSGHPYADPGYAASVAGGAEVVRVAAWDVPVLLRAIPGTDRVDAAGCAPLTPLSSDADLRAGLDELRRRGAVSVVLVADPLGGPASETLAAAFDVCRPFKTHYVVERGAAPPEFARRHRSEIAKATKVYSVKVFNLGNEIEAVAALHRDQLLLHGIDLPIDDARRQIEALARLPGTRVTGAFREERLESAVLFVAEIRTAYVHLTGTSAAGRASGAHHACYAAAIESFSPGITIDLGGAPGLHDDPNHGLALFKRGFATTTRMAWLCGSILDPAAYAVLAQGRPDDFFPAYRTSRITER